MIPIAEPYMNKEELANAVEAIKSNWISSKGKFILEFEKDFAKYCNRKHGIATSNGTVALHLALKALGIKEGDEVIVPDLTFIATANAVKYCNAHPILVDVDNRYFGLDPRRIEEKITKRTKAIIIVHLYGHPCAIDPILEIAKKHKLYVIEDAAEAHGAEYKGRKIGSFGDISCFSFFGNKIITTGEGGMCLTNNDLLAEKMLILRDHGMSKQKKYWHDVVGFNYRMTNVQAAIGIAQLKKLDKFVDKKRKIASLYKNGLSELIKKGLIEFAFEMPETKNVYWMSSILLTNKSKLNRDQLMKELEKRGVETRPFFYPLHIMPPYKSNDIFLVSEDVSRRGLNLPSGVKLTSKQINTVIKSIKKLLS